MKHGRPPTIELLAKQSYWIFSALISLGFVNAQFPFITILYYQALTQTLVVSPGLLYNFRI